MLPKRRRLAAAEVREVLRRGRPSRAAYLSLKYLPTPLPLRSAAVVPKSLAKKAVKRNRLRRALYRALRDTESQGRAVIFVNKLPPEPLVPAFVADLEVLLKTTPRLYV